MFTHEEEKGKLGKSTLARPQVDQTSQEMSTKECYSPAHSADGELNRNCGSDETSAGAANTQADTGTTPFESINF